MAKRFALVFSRFLAWWRGGVNNTYIIRRFWALLERGAGGSEAGKVVASASMEEEGDRGNLRRCGFFVPLYGKNYVPVFWVRPKSLTTLATSNNIFILL